MFEAEGPRRSQSSTITIFDAGSIIPRSSFSALFWNESELGVELQVLIGVFCEIFRKFVNLCHYGQVCLKRGGSPGEKEEDAIDNFAERLGSG